MEHTRFVGLDIHKERISVAVAESGRSGAVEYLGEIANEPGAVRKLCGRLRRPGRPLVAAERAGRRCFGLEIDPLYVDTIIRRWQAFTGDHAHHAVTARAFDDVAFERDGNHGA